MTVYKEGIMAFYKPKGPTSHDIINQLRRLTGIKKIGHAGTLDPLARGVLVVGIGAKATKKLSAIVAKEKEYVAVIRLGEESDTDDAEGPIKKFSISPPSVASGDLRQASNSQFLIPARKNIDAAVKLFVGKITQVPPIYSALKIKGAAAYARARRGEKIKMKSRAVEIKEIEILSYAWPDITLRVVTGPGVYIRALARDVGRALGTGAYLASLERTRVGKFTKENAVSIY